MTNIDSMNRVRFHPFVQAVSVLSIDDYTPREIAASWYSDEEMEKITNRTFKVIRSMDAGRGKKYCIRGLEGHTKLGCITKKRNRSTAFGAVLMEQSKQWTNNTVDEQAIADVYRRTTSSCRMWAQVMGRQDRQVADALLDEVEYMPACRLNECKGRTSTRPKEGTFKISSQRSTIRARHSANPARLPPVRSSRTARLVAVH